MSAVLQPGHIADVEIRNRIIRSSTSETLADDRGLLTDAYHDFHLRLARNGVGLIFTGHCSVHPRGNYIRGMTALDRDDLRFAVVDESDWDDAELLCETVHDGDSQWQELTKLVISNNDLRESMATRNT